MTKTPPGWTLRNALADRLWRLSHPVASCKQCGSTEDLRVNQKCRSVLGVLPAVWWECDDCFKERVEVDDGG